MPTEKDLSHVCEYCKVPILNPEWAKEGVCSDYCKGRRMTNTVPPHSRPMGVTLDVSHVIGRTDRVLSELLYLAESVQLDVIDAQTLKHHADDLIGVGQKMIKVLANRGIGKQVAEPFGGSGRPHSIHE